MVVGRQVDVDGDRQVVVQAYHSICDPSKPSFLPRIVASQLSLPHYSIMSTKAKLTLAATSLGALGIIIFVHHGQKVEKAVCLARSVSSGITLTSELGNARRCHP